MTAPPAPQSSPRSPRPISPKRVDLHCHSDASNKASEVVLNAISCPECYSRPEDVYAQARRRGMDFVTLTDHDTIAGALALAERDDLRADVLVGEELTCWFPEDDCKLHLLLWGVGPEEHARLQSLARSIYDVAAYVEGEQIAHAVAHPIYRQNEKLERWHVERLLVLFKGFECINGAHSPLHREAFEPLLDRLTRDELAKLADKHDLKPRWPEPWVKARTAGSDDHGLLNVGRTWTEFPADVRTKEDVLRCLRQGVCQPGGEAGSSTKLAHTFYSVTVRYYSRHLLAPSAGGAKPNLPTTLLQTMVGERRIPRKGELARRALAHKVKQLGGKILRPFSRRNRADGSGAGHVGTGILKNLFIKALGKRAGEFPALREILEQGLPPLAEHEEMFRFVSALNRDVTGGLADAISKSIDDASFTGLFDAIAALLGQQFVLAPYYFAVFHQNKERRLLRQITGLHHRIDAGSLRVGLFTDTFDEINGVGRFLRDMADMAGRSARQITIHTCTDAPRAECPRRHNFAPLLSRAMPYYSELKLNLPPVLEVLEWADRQQFDAIHVSTPGPMGLCGWLAAKMLRVPVLATYHTDFPAYVDHYTRDHRATMLTRVFMKWFYGQAAAVFARSREYLHTVRDLGIPLEKLLTIEPGIDTDRFNPARRDDSAFARLGVAQPKRLFYCGRVSVEKNLPLLADVFRRLCARRADTALIVAGDGPYLPEMRDALRGLPAYFLGYQNDAQLGPVYAGSDLFVFPSRTDTLGQVVIEAQASGLPALVSTEGGPKETILDGVTGLVLPAGNPADAAAWCDAIDGLLSDDAKRHRMGRAAPQRVSRFSREQTFDKFWDEHVKAAQPPDEAPFVVGRPARVGV